MQWMMLALAAFCLIMLLHYVFKILKMIIVGGGKGHFEEPRISSPLADTPQWHDLLAARNSYYRNLTPELQAEFLKRTRLLTGRFHWISGDHHPITPDMKLLVSASAVQLLFGRPDADLGHYNTIVLYQDAYQNWLTLNYHKGEVNKREIVLSFKHFEEGYANDTDKVNLGLHEMTHALDLGTFLGHGKSYIGRRLLDNFINKAYPHFTAFQNGDTTFLRSYGATNFREFFAVAVEHFFEAPGEFTQQMPELYRELCLLLNQDPAAGIYRGISPTRFPNLDNNTPLPWSESTPTRHLTAISPHSNVTIKVLVSALIFFIYCAAQNGPHSLYLNLPFIVLLGGILWPTLVGAKQYLAITDTHFVVLSFRKKQKQAIHLKNIVMMDFERGLTHQSIYVCWFQQHQIQESVFKFNLSEDASHKLRQHLNSCGVTVMVDGKYESR